MAKISTMVIALGNRIENATQLQSILTKYGCQIKARLGLHEGTGDQCTNYGIIFLQLAGKEDDFKALEEEINKLPQAKARLVQIELD
ncbi:MAG: hypothetical protein GX766_08090 [Firmicutes bacterium]|jgi:hypothetical protein|nr:hypothetical protein [Bacillota bacterium]HOB21932.1 hypothetical protein [Bacillota bacterium]HQD39410.1 hypothetical protein [Bacillota bacterium]